MEFIEMTRKAVSYRIDDRLIEALDSVSREGNISANRYLENLILRHMKELGAVDPDMEPLGEKRGSNKGERRGGRKKAVEPLLENEKKTDPSLNSETQESTVIEYRRQEENPTVNEPAN